MTDLKTAPSKASTHPKSRFATGFSLIASMIAIAALILSAWSYHLTSLEQTKLTNVPLELHSTLNSLKAKQSTLESTLTQLSNTVTQIEKQNLNLPAEAAASQARYLVELAQLNLTYGGNLKAAKEQLHLALATLNKANSTAIETLRKKILTDLERLESAPVLDKTTLLNKLQQLTNEVKQLPTLPTVTKETVISAPKEGETTWDKFTHSLEKLKGFVVIQKLKDPTTYAFTPEQRILTKQLLLIKLLQAQWAVLTLDQTTYENSLNTSKTLLDSLSLPNNKKTTLLQELNELTTFSLTPTIQLSANSPNSSVALPTKPPQTREAP